MLMIKASMGSGSQGAELVVKGERLQNMVETEPKLFLIQGDVYEVEKLVAVKIVKGKKLYRVRWRGYGKESDTLEPEENLFSCKDMIEELELKIKERHEKKKGKKLLKTQTISRELRSIDRIPEEKSVRAATTWQATEIQPSENNMKDTFWRDFDEGKINVSEAVFDKDMYSKVKERAARTSNLMETGRSGECSAQKENPPLCPKVLLKRKTCIKTNDNLTYKSSLKVKPMSLHVRKRKKYDVLRDYRKRRNRMHRKRNIDENGQRKLLKTMGKHDNYNGEAEQNGSNILQELLINDEKGSVFTDYVLNSSKSESENVSCMSKLNALNNCEEVLRVDNRNQSLMCRLSIQDYSMETFPSQNQIGKSTSDQFDHNSRLGINVTIESLFNSLLDAIINDKLENLRRLCNSSQIINCYRADGTTALMIAALYGKYYATEILLKAKAHKDKQNWRGETALMLACRNKHPEIVRLLLDYGANFALTNAEGYNVLKLSRCYSRRAISDILFDHVVRVVSEFEKESKSLIGPIGCIKYALFPIQRFSLNEGPVHSVNFQHHVNLEHNEMQDCQNLLFIAHCTIEAEKVTCEFDVDAFVNDVTINGVKQELFEDIDSLFKVTGLQTGSNKVKITTVHSPQSEVKLIVCAYKVYHTVCFPAQKFREDFRSFNLVLL